jgi:hypothetical protein
MAITHGLRYHPLYRIWSGIKSRCNRPKATGYKWYGGKGIKICDEWKHDFVSFYNWAISSGWESNLTIDRIDSKKDYEPCNCRFITKSENCKKPRIENPVFNFKTGENNYNSKLKKEDVLSIRNKISNNIPVAAIAQEFGVKAKAIYDIRNGKKWKSV